MFDLTSKIKLGPALQKKYALARILLHLAFLAGVIFVADRVLFPSATLVFSFGNANSLKNTLGAPHTEQQPDVLAKSSVTANGNLIFDANPVGNFSDATITFGADKTSQNIEGSAVRLRKSYQAFFYPTGAPIGFRDGTLLATPDGSYYIVSDGALRRFSSTDIILKLGYPKSAFLTVSSDDLRYNSIGADITDASVYPDDTFFAIGDTYYEFKGSQLFPFVSTRAFFSQFDALQAIIKGSDFLNRYQVSDSILGFADGTLGSSDISVFILSQGKSYPIADVATFLSMGFNWNDVVALDADELGTYQRQKQFTYDQPHPDGTLFLDQKTQKYFVIENGAKRPIKSAAIAQTYSKQKPVLADLEQSETSVSCQLKKVLLSSSTYACTAALDSFGQFIGNDYRIDTTFSNETKISSIDTTFSTPLTWENLRSSLSKIKENLKNNYVPQQ